MPIAPGVRAEDASVRTGRPVSRETSRNQPGGRPSLGFECPARRASPDPSPPPHLEVPLLSKLFRSLPLALFGLAIVTHTAGAASST